jgi:hypothetical protein
MKLRGNSRGQTAEGQWGLPGLNSLRSDVFKAVRQGGWNM